MTRSLWPITVVAVALCQSSPPAAQAVRAAPRPPAQAPNAPRPEGESAAPDGYAPIPAWLGQTRAAHPTKTPAYRVETVAGGLTGAFCFDFLPDGRIIVG